MKVNIIHVTSTVNQNIINLTLSMMMLSMLNSFHCIGLIWEMNLQRLKDKWDFFLFNRGGSEIQVMVTITDISTINSCIINKIRLKQ